jgi:hypothetical protein
MRSRWTSTLLRRRRERVEARSWLGRPYPPAVSTPAERRRWDLAEKAAVSVAESVGGNEVTVYLATRSLYNSDIPTDG